MPSLVILLLMFALCQAKPHQSPNGALHPSPVKGGEQHIAGGTDAEPGEFPWQLSVQRRSATWAHSFGATLLSANYGLTAAHCVHGTIASNIRVVAGLYKQSDLTGTQTVDISSYTLDYGVGLASYANDIAILNFATSVVIGGNVQPATLPVDNSNSYAGDTCIITGWGSTDPPQRDALQKASTPVISTNQCANLMSGSPGTISDAQICVYNPDNAVGSCSGDNGGPLNCPDGVTRVAGVGSYITADGTDNCQQFRPSVYTRVSNYLSWIAANTP